MKFGRERTNADGDFDGLLLHVLEHIGALDDDTLSGGRGDRRRGFSVVGIGLHGKRPRNASLGVLAHFVVFCFRNQRFA